MWEEYTEKQEIKGRYNIASILRISKPTIIDNEIFYKVPNNTSGLEVESEKNQLILFLRNKLKNKVNLTIEIDKTIDKKLAYTNKDKYDILRKKNPLIEEFRKSLGLSV